MSVSLTRILANAGIPVAMNALVPGSGMADMFIRNAGAGIARGIVNSPSGGGGPQRMGGPGSPEGAMPTRKFGATRETAGELKSGFMDWLKDPLQSHREKKEQERDTALAYRLGITGGEFSLIHRPAMSLIKKRTGDVQTNIMILQFRVQQFMARNLSAIASTLGVQKSKLLHEHPDPNKSWFGQILSSLHKDMQQNPIFSTIESVGKHALNIGRILNPFTMGSRAKKGVKSFGEFMQRLAMGREGFEMMQDPERLYEKAGLKQDFQTKSVNLMKINNEYQKHQLNMLYNILGATKEMLGIFGGSYQNQKLDLTHDEFEGTLKTHRQLRQAEGMRAMKLETTFQAATRRSIVGRIGSIVGGIRNIGYSVVERARPKQASRRDLYALDYMFNTPGFFDSESGVRGVSDNLDQFIDRYRGQDIDWYNKKNSPVANEFKFWIEDAIEHPKLGHERQAEDLREAWELGKNQSAVQVSLASTHNAARRVGNIFANLTGHNIANTDPLSRHPREAKNKFETYTRFGGDLSMAGTQVGSGGERAVNEYHNTGILPAVLRSVPILGALFGVRQQLQVGGLQTRYEEAMRSPYQGPNEDKIFGYGQNTQGGQSGGGGSGGKPLFTMNVKIVDVSQNLITKIESTLNSVLTTFSLRFGAVLSNLVNTDFENVFLNVERQFVTDLFDKLEEWNKSKDPKKGIPVSDKQPPVRSAHGNVFSGGNISDYSGKIVDQPTLFKYDELHKFAKGSGLMGEAGPEGVFPLKKNEKGDYGIGAPSIMRVILVDTNGNPLPISLPQNQTQMYPQTEKKKIDDVSSKKSDVKPLRAGTDSQMSSLLSRDQVVELLRNLAVQKEINSKFVARKRPLIPLQGILGKLSNLFSGIQTEKKKIEDISSNRSDFKPLRASVNSQMASLMPGGQPGKTIRDLSLRKYYNENFVQKNPLLTFHGAASKFNNLFSGMTGIKPEDKKRINENDNTTTTIERQKDIEDKQEKKEEAKRAEEQQVNEEDKKSTLHRIADLLDPRSATGKLVDKYRKHEEKGSDSQNISFVPGNFKEVLLRELSDGKGLKSNLLRSIPISLLSGAAGKLSNLFSGMTGKSEDKKKIDENDNTTTAAERQQSIEDKQEKKAEEKREEEQQVNEEDKKSTLHKIADLLDPRTAIGKLVEKYREHKQKKKENEFKLPFDISSWISKLGIGLIGNELLKMLPEGFFTGENGILSQIWKFTKDSVGKLFEKAKKYVEDNAFDWFRGAWEHFHEHPLLDAGILMTMFPGTVGKLLVKVAGKALTNPASIPAIIGVGGLVYNLVDSFTKSKDETGEFSLWKFLKEFFIGSESGLGSIIGKAGTYGFIGARIGAHFGGVGALPGFLIGGAIGSIIGSLNTKDEKGEFSLGEFFKSFFLGKNSAGGLANGAGNAIKWGFIGASIGIPFGGIGAVPGFLLGAALGGIIGGITGYLGYDKLETGSTVSKLLKWKSGSFAHKLANFPGAQFPPFIGPFIFGTIGTILDLGGDLFEKIYGVVNDAWVWLKKKIPFLGDDDDEYEEKEPDEITKKAKAAAEEERSKTVKYQHENGTVLTVKATGKEARYIEAAKTPEERRQRVSETRRSHIQEDRLIEEARAGKKKYDIKKYVELKRKWEKEDAERNEKYAHEIDIPVTNFSGKESVMGFDDFKSTKENAEEYQKLMNEKKDDDAIRFAKGIKAKQDEEDAKRKSERDSALKKIEVGSSPDDLKLDAQRKASSAPAAMAAKVTVDKQSDASGKELGLGSNPDDLKLDAQRKASSAPAAMSAKLGVGDDDDDDMGSNVDVTHLQEATQKGMNEWTDQHKPSKETQERIGAYITKLKEKAQKGTKEWIDKYNEWNEKNKPSKEEQARINAYNKAASEIDLSSAGLGTSAPGPESVTPEKDKKKEEIPLYRRPENIAKYNAAAQNIDLSSAGLGLSAPGPDPSSVPAAAKASEDASKKKDENKGKSGSSGPAATPAAAQAAPAATAPAAAPVETPAPAAPSGETPASTPAGGGQLNWIENLISKTIQNTFKAGEAIFGAAKTAYNTAQQVVNGGPGAPGDPGGGGAVGSWGGGFSNAEYLPGKPGAASLGTHFITAKPKDPTNRPGRNNNPLNVKLHKLGTDKADKGGHRIFGNVDDGIRGNFWQLQRYINGTYGQGKFGQLNTARKIIPVWAPVKDGNNPTAYLQHLQQYGVDIDAQIDLNSPASLDPLAKLMAGMAREEGWGIINPEEIKKVLTYGNHQGAPGTAQSSGDAAAAPTSAPEAVKKYLSIMARNAQGAQYSTAIPRRNQPGAYDCSSFTVRSLVDAGIFPKSLIQDNAGRVKNSPTTGELPSLLGRYGFKFHPYNFRGVKTAPPELQPGDILTADKSQTGHSMGHVVTYWGNNKVIAAHNSNSQPQVGIKGFYTSKQGGYWRYSPGGGSNPEDLFNKTGQTTTENAILPNSAKTPSLFKKLKKTLGLTKLSWPTISSKINSDYGTRDPSQFAGAKGKISRTHGGVDIQAAEGDPVYSTMSGTVVGTDPDYGTIEVQHPNGWLSKYLHLGRFIARAGEQVKSGQIIGEAGGVGKGGKTDAFNPHLHFELIKDKTKIPPLPMVAAAGLDQPTKNEQIDNKNAYGSGGPDFTPRINKQINEYLENSGVGGPEISVKSDNRVIAELKKLQVIMMGVMKAAGKPSIAVSAPQQSGGGNPQNQVDESGASDVFTDSAFSQIGGLLPNLNVSMTGLGTSIA